MTGRKDAIADKIETASRFVGVKDFEGEISGQYEHTDGERIPGTATHGHACDGRLWQALSAKAHPPTSGMTAQQQRKSRLFLISSGQKAYPVNSWIRDIRR